MTDTTLPALGSNARHGHCVRDRESPTYTSWRSMHARCSNPKNENFSRYGGRGITVCDRWRSFDLFLADMGIRPDGGTLDRWPNRDGNYELGNCRWASQRDQQRNRCNNKLTLEGAQSIVAMVRAGSSRQRVADAFGVSRALVRKIVAGTTWSEASHA